MADTMYSSERWRLTAVGSQEDDGEDAEREPEPKGATAGKSWDCVFVESAAGRYAPSPAPELPLPPSLKCVLLTVVLREKFGLALTLPERVSAVLRLW
jgi:hypothetical protein